MANAGWPDIVAVLLAEANFMGRASSTPPAMELQCRAYTESLLRRAAEHIKELREEIEDLKYELIEESK